MLVRGHVSPVLSPDETVALSYAIGGGDWKETAVRVASDGTFRVRLQHVHGDVQLVAQVLGNGTVAGAGTAVARLTVTH